VKLNKEVLERKYKMYVSMMNSTYRSGFYSKKWTIK
jgi:hypothetical protein